MAQYKTGTVSVTNGSATVTGSGTSWSGEIAAGDLFTIVGDNAWYEVASVGSNTSITLSANYAGTTGSGKSYAISRDFTTRLALPYPQKGDIETASIIKRAFEQIDTETNIATANYSATTAPTANDDSGDGYSIGSWWVNVTADEAYLCVDSTVGAAVWTKISVDVPSEIVSLLAGQSVSMASLTLSGGTANGVLYLNGSKVATSGSALTFDGTNLAVGGTATEKLFTNGALRVTGTQTTAGSGIYLDYGSGIGGTNVYGPDNSTYGQWRVYLASANGGLGGEQMRLTSTGLGIGTSSPSVKLHSYTSGNTPILSETSGGVTSYLGLKNTGGMAYIASQNNNILFATSSNADTRATLDSSGNLGLGVTPSASSACVNMELSGYGATLSARNTSSAPQFAMMSNGVGNWYAPTYKINGKATMYLMQGNDGSHAWYTAGTGTAGDAISFTQALTLDADGNLLAGTTTASNTPSQGITLMQNTSVGSIGIGHANGTSSGNGYLNFAYNGSAIGSVTQSGTTAVLYNVTSDQRLKENIVDAPEFGSVIDAIKVRSYDWKTDQTHQRAGFIAQELVQVAPEAVHQPANPEQMMAVDYSKLVPMLVKEIQSLRARVASLESK